MLIAAGAKVQERDGSRVAVLLHGIVAVFHRPHPQKETEKGAIKSVREFLLRAGVVELNATGEVELKEET